jgi:hypothetical protein
MIETPCNDSMSWLVGFLSRLPTSVEERERERESFSFDVAFVRTYDVWIDVALV